MIPRLQASSDYVHERDQTLKELINPLVVTGVENELLDEEMDPKGDLPKEFPLAPTIVCKEKGMRGSQLEGLVRFFIKWASLIGIKTELRLV